MDDFNRRSGPLGGMWVGAIDGVVVSSGRFKPTTSKPAFAVWNGAVLGADQEAYVKFLKVTKDSPRQGLVLKAQGVVMKAGAIEVRYDADRKKVFVATYTAGRGWEGRGAGISVKLSEDDVLGARAYGNGVVEVYRNGVKLGTRSVAGWAHAGDGGRIGLTLESASSTRLDDFGGGSGDFGPAPQNPPPLVKISATPNSGRVPLTVSFSGAGSSEYGSVSCEWNFGDGTRSSNPNPSHAYSVGRFRAMLTVKDERGGTASDTMVVSASASPRFPWSPIVDDFNRRSGPLGGAWVGAIDGVVVSSGRFKPTTSKPVFAVWNGAVLGVDQEAYVRFLKVTEDSPRQGLVLKAQGPVMEAGAIEVRYDADRKKVFVATYTAGRGWEGRGAGISTEFSEDDVLGARAYGDGEVEVYRNGVKLGTRSVAGWAHAGDGGRIGLTLESAASTRLDDFGGGSNTTLLAGQTESVGANVLSDQGLEPASSISSAPSILELSRCVPNPFVGETQVRFGLPADGQVRLCVYDVQGRHVTTLVHGPQRAGWHSVSWNGRGVDGAPARAGVYFLRLESGGLDRVRKIVLAK